MQYIIMRTIQHYNNVSLNHSPYDEPDESRYEHNHSLHHPAHGQEQLWEGHSAYRRYGVPYVANGE